MKNLACALSLVCLAAAPPAAGQDLMRQGVDACNRGRYQEAASYFQQAAMAQPQSKLAWLHLANARVEAFMRSADGEQRDALGDAARTTLHSLLARDPNEAVALWDLALLEMNGMRFDEALAAMERLIALQPANKRAHYTAGVIEWARAYPVVIKARQPGAPVEGLKAKLGPGITAGHEHIQRALALDPGYRNALAYDNLLYRLDAMLAPTQSEAQALNRKADKSMQAAMEAAKEEPAPRAALRADAPPPPVEPPPPPPPPAKR